MPSCCKGEPRAPSLRYPFDFIQLLGGRTLRPAKMMEKHYRGEKRWLAFIRLQGPGSLKEIPSRKGAHRGWKYGVILGIWINKEGKLCLQLGTELSDVNAKSLLTVHGNKDICFQHVLDITLSCTWFCWHKKFYVPQTGFFTHLVFLKTNNQQKNKPPTTPTFFVKYLSPRHPMKTPS